MNGCGMYSFGRALRVTLFGESHGAGVGAVLDGLPAGIPFSADDVTAALACRRPSGDTATERHEPDRWILQGGVYCGMTSGTPLAIFIPNEDIRNDDYDDSLTLPRPGHADYPVHIRMGGYEDPRGGGAFSGRVTAALVAVGAVVGAFLGQHGIAVGTHVLSVGGVADEGRFPDMSAGDLRAALSALRTSAFPVLSPAAGERMRAEILCAKVDGDSLGGILEGAVVGLPVGVGEPFFDSVESMISHALFSVPSIKGVEFGDGFALSAMRGSEANDPYRTDGKNIYTMSNHAGGTLGGLTNGAPVIFRAAIKPTPSIAKTQKTVNLRSGENANISVCGRHDPCIAPRAAAVVTAVTALAVGDLLLRIDGGRA